MYTLQIKLYLLDSYVFFEAELSLEAQNVAYSSKNSVLIVLTTPCLYC